MAVRVSSPVFVARDEELAVLDAALERSSAGQPTLVVVAGDAGIGKTRLVAEWLERRRRSGARPLVGGSVKVGRAGLPYAPIVEALRTLARETPPADLKAILGPARGEVARLLPELGPEPATLGAVTEGAAQARLFELLLGVLGRVAADGPAVLVVEDIHWMDDGTRDLLVYLARNLSRERLLVVLTHRSDEPRRDDSLRGFLAELDRSPRVRRLALSPLDAGETLQLLGEILGGPPSPALADAIYRRSEGNAFYSEELLATSLDGGGALPGNLRETLLSRIADVDSATREILRMTAVAGRPIDERLLAAVGETSEAAVVEPLREAVDRHLLVADDDGQYRFRHALLREAVYVDLIPAERRLAHGRLAGVLQQRTDLRASSPAAATGELAHHWAAAGRQREALGASVTAAIEAERVYAFGEAHRHYERALELWRSVGPEERPDLDEVALLHRTAEAANLAGEVPRAIELLRRGIAEVDERRDASRAAVLYSRLGYLLWGEAGETEAAMAAHREAYRLAPADPPSPERARILSGLAAALMGGGRYRESASHAEEALRVARAAGARADEARALNVLGSDLCAMGDVEAGLARLREALAIADELDRPEARVVAYHNLALNLRFVDRYEEAFATATAGVRATIDAGLERRFGGDLRGAAADALYWLGRWDAAEALLADALALQRVGAAPYPLTVLARIRTARGAFDDAQQLLARADEAAVDPDMRAYVAAAQSDLASWLGRYDDARGAVEAGIREVARSDDELLAAPLCAIGMRAEAERAETARAHRDAAGEAGAQTAADALAALAEKLAGPAAGAPRPSARAELAEAEAERRRVRGESDYASWADAATQWEAIFVPYRAAYTRYREGEALLRRGGDRRDAERALRTAHGAATELGAGPLIRSIEALATRGRLSLAERDLPRAEAPVSEGAGQAADSARPTAPRVHDVGLSARELEVLTLVAQGRTNSQIAEELFISPKTAGVHVTHILDKLSVSNRVEAAMVAARLGLLEEPTAERG